MSISTNAKASAADVEEARALRTYTPAIPAEDLARLARHMSPKKLSLFLMHAARCGGPPDAVHAHIACLLRAGASVVDFHLTPVLLVAATPRIAAQLLEAGAPVYDVCQVNGVEVHTALLVVACRRKIHWLAALLARECAWPQDVLAVATMIAADPAVLTELARRLEPATITPTILRRVSSVAGARAAAELLSSRLHAALEAQHQRELREMPALFRLIREGQPLDAAVADGVEPTLAYRGEPAVAFAYRHGAFRAAAQLIRAGAAYVVDGVSLVDTATRERRDATVISLLRGAVIDHDAAVKRRENIARAAAVRAAAAAAAVDDDESLAALCEMTKGRRQ